MRARWSCSRRWSEAASSSPRAARSASTFVPAGGGAGFQFRARSVASPAAAWARRARTAAGDDPRVPQRRVELRHGGVLAAGAEGAERLLAVRGFGPEGGDRDDLLVQAGRAGAVERQPPEQENARLGAGASDDAAAGQAVLESLAGEPGEQTADQPVFEMQLHDVGRVGAVRQDGRAEGDGPQRGGGTIVLQPLAPFPAADAQIVERLRPGAAGEGGIGGVELE